ncbi:unnamed protein product, partial [marine sediment metagenome]
VDCFTSEEGEGLTWLGDDLYFGTYDENKIYKLTTMTGTYHIKVPSVSNTVDTDFYMYYGIPDAIDGSDKNNVWDINFKGVYHLREAIPIILDSTSNANNGVKKSAVEPINVAGKVEFAQDFDGENDYINVGNEGLNPGTSVGMCICKIP